MLDAGAYLGRGGIGNINAVEHDPGAKPILAADANGCRFAIAAIHGHRHSRLCVEQGAQIRVAKGADVLFVQHADRYAELIQKLGCSRRHDHSFLDGG